MNKLRKALKWIGITAATPVVLFLVLAVLIYLPPVQRFVVNRVAATMSARTGMNIRVGSVRLAFPLDLALHQVIATQQRDTLVDARSLRLNVQLLPLFHGRADVDGVELYGTHLNTMSMISDVQVRGYAGELTAAAHGADWRNEVLNLDKVRLADANLNVALSDTARKDTTSAPVKWQIRVKRADIARSVIALSMPGDSMRLWANIGLAALRSGHFDLGKSVYGFRLFELRDCALRYDLPHVRPTRVGLDPNHLSLTGLSLRADTLSYDASGRLRVGLRGLRLKERCGLQITDLRGGLQLDSARFSLTDAHLRTLHSYIDADAALDLRALTPGRGGRCKAQLKGALGASDLRVLGQGYAPASVLKRLPSRDLRLDVSLDGNADHVRLTRLEAAMPGTFTLKANGYARYPLKDWRAGELRIDLRTQNLAPVRRLIPADLTRTVDVPDGIALRGTVRFKASAYNADLRVNCGGGSLTARGHADLRRERYQLSARANAFPVARFVKGVDVSPFSGTLQASGTGFDLLSSRASLTAKARVGSFSYGSHDLSGVSFDARLHGGKALCTFASTNALAQLTGRAELLIGRHGYDLVLQADVPHIDLYGLGISKDTLEVGTLLDVKARANRRFTAYSANGSITRTHFTSPRMSTMAKDIFFDFSTAADTTTAFLSAGDMRLNFGSKGDVPRLTKQLGQLGRELASQASRKELEQERLKRLAPVMTLHLDAGRNNPIYNIARLKGYSFSSAHLNLNTDPLRGMTGDARLGNLHVGSLLLDTINTVLRQDTTGVQLYALVKNGRDNPVPMEVKGHAYIQATDAGVELTYLDEQGRKGVDLGLRARLVDGGLNVHLYPERPVLAYRTFKVNADNFLFIDKQQRVRANVDLLADDGTGLKLYGEPNDSLNDLTLSVNRVNLGELSSVLPYMPKLGGMLSGDVHVTEAWAEEDGKRRKSMSAMASISTTNFAYEGVALGDLGMDAIYLPKAGGEHHASAFISSGGNEVLACNGTYRDRNGGEFEGDAQLHDFPLQLLNGFMAGTDVALKGIAGGDISVQTAGGKPVLNGQLDLDSAHIYSDVYGFDFRTDERAVAITDSRLQFDNYNLYSTGKNPLVLNGTFDMSDLEHMRMDFTMRANDFELVNTRKKARSMVYGKVYANYIGTLKGTTDDVTVRGKLEVLDRTDMTYILKDSPLSVDDRLGDLVEFVSFRDTLRRETVKPAPSGSFDLALGISVSDAAQFHCNLSDDGQSYIDLEGGGDLVLRMTQQGDMRLTGRFTANSGEMKYALPVIPLKTFQLVQGSSVEFTGDPMNPTLNITAKERTKAVVTENDKQRSVAFDVGVVITKPLNNMGLEFTIEAPEDLTVQNQLASMSTQQRAKAAVAMMATGMFMTDETMMSGSGFKANNALNAFLQSEIQSIAGSALKTIDINLGVESGTSETGSSTTDYSFQFAKRFWGNRISVIIGGKVSTGADAQNSAESFINNVSVEYRLDASATRYVKVFYDRNTQDPLEGQLTRTGAGLVLRRKTDRLGELFIFKKKKKEPQPAGTR